MCAELLELALAKLCRNRPHKRRRLRSKVEGLSTVRIAAPAAHLATGAIVVLVSAETSGLVGGSGNRVVLVALPATAARTVAAAALVDAIGVTLH